MSRVIQAEPADFTDVRSTNRAVVLRHVRAHAPCSRAEIASATGLNKATVSNLVADLLRRRVVRETGLTEHRIGRPATMIVLDGDPYVAIGLEVSADQVTVVAQNLGGAELLSWRRAADFGERPGRATAGVAALARRVVNKVTKDGRQVLGMAIGVPGSADETGTVLAAPSVGWVGVDLAAQLSVALGDPTYPITVHGSADLGAAAECQLGAHAGSANLVYLTGTAAISAGVVADGRSLRGEQGFAGEIGHLQLDPSGPRCRCGRRGCLEALAGVSEIVRRVTAADGPAMPPDDLTTEVDEVVRLAKAADGRTLDVLADAGAWLGRAAAALANIVNPEVVVLGGYFARLAPWVLPAARDAVVAGTYPAEPTRISLAASTLGARATVYGGVIHVLDAVDVDDLSVATGHASH